MSDRRLVRDYFATNPITAAGANRDARGLYGGNPVVLNHAARGELPARLFVRCGERLSTDRGNLAAGEQKSAHPLDLRGCVREGPLSDTNSETPHDLGWVSELWFALAAIRTPFVTLANAWVCFGDKPEIVMCSFAWRLDRAAALCAKVCVRSMLVCGRAR